MNVARQLTDVTDVSRPTRLTLALKPVHFVLAFSVDARVRRTLVDVCVKVQDMFICSVFKHLDKVKAPTDFAVSSGPAWFATALPRVDAIRARTVHTRVRRALVNV